MTIKAFFSTCAALVLIGAAASTTGSWSLTTQGNRVSLHTSWSDASGHDTDSDSIDVDARALGIAPALASSGQHVTFTLHRQAGDMSFDGWVAQGRGGGTYTFAPSTAFFDDLSERGLAVHSVGEEMTAATLDITRDYIDTIERAGVRLNAFHEVITFRAMGITDAYIADLAGAGFSHLDPNVYVTFKALGVDSRYVKYLRDHGFHDLTPQQVIRLRAMHI